MKKEALTSPIKVYIVDDSAVVRTVLTNLLEEFGNINVVGSSQDPIFAEPKIKKLNPDVLLLDIEMPRMDGLTFLRKIMAENPMPVVICSGATSESSQTSVEALSLGAIEIVTKAKSNVKSSLEEQYREIVDAIHNAAKADLSKITTSKRSNTANFKTHKNKSSVKVDQQPANNPKRNSASLLKVAPKHNADVVLSSDRKRNLGTQPIVAIGTSTGGTQALETIATQLTPDCPGIVVVQHMNAAFTAPFAQRLNKLCEVEIVEGVDGEAITQGKVIIAPGDKHMLVNTTNRGIPYIQVKDGPLVARHRPSVDVLFRSVSKCYGRNALGIIMTGMGDDGAAGLKEMHDAGSDTIGQNKETCVVYGMPAVAFERGAVNRELALTDIIQEIQTFSP